MPAVPLLQFTAMPPMAGWQRCSPPPSNKCHPNNWHCFGSLLCHFCCLHPHIAHQVSHLTLSVAWEGEDCRPFSLLFFPPLSLSPAISTQSVVLLEVLVLSPPPCRHLSGCAELYMLHRKAPMQSWLQYGGSTFSLTAALAWFLVFYSDSNNGLAKSFVLIAPIYVVLAWQIPCSFLRSLMPASFLFKDSRILTGLV